MSGARATARLAALLTLGPVLAAPRSAAGAPHDRFDIGANGSPRISGGLNARVIGTVDLRGDLVVKIDFGELSPVNRSAVVRVVVPVALRTRDPYQLLVTVSAPHSSDPYAVQPSDDGFGLQNLRILGHNGTPCGGASVIHAPFDHDPEATMSTSGRVSYPGTLASLGPNTPTPVLNGPTLSRGSINPRQKQSGWGVDAIFTVVPQFFSTGSFRATVTFRVVAGPPFPCR